MIGFAPPVSASNPPAVGAIKADAANSLISASSAPSATGSKPAKKTGAATGSRLLKKAPVATGSRTLKQKPKPHCLSGYHWRGDSGGFQLRGNDRDERGNNPYFGHLSKDALAKLKRENRGKARFNAAIETWIRDKLKEKGIEP